MATTDDSIYLHELWVINSTYSWWKAKHTEKAIDVLQKQI